jgi:hypothetical protein
VELSQHTTRKEQMRFLLLLLCLEVSFQQCHSTTQATAIFSNANESDLSTLQHQITRGQLLRSIDTAVVQKVEERITEFAPVTQQGQRNLLSLVQLFSDFPILNEFTENAIDPRFVLNVLEGLKGSIFLRIFYRLLGGSSEVDAHQGNLKFQYRHRTEYYFACGLQKFQ